MWLIERDQLVPKDVIAHVIERDQLVPSEVDDDWRYQIRYHRREE